MWSEYAPGQSTTLVKFPDYWRGEPKLDRIIRRNFQDPASALLAFDAGEIHLTYITADEVPRERDNPNGTSSCPATRASTTGSPPTPSRFPSSGSLKFGRRC